MMPVALTCAAVVSAMSIGACGSGRHQKTSTRTASGGLTKTVTPPKPNRPIAATVETAGVPTSRSAYAEAHVPMPQSITGWRRVFADDFASDEYARRGAFKTCVWGRTLRDSTCAGLPSSAAARWFAYPDGDNSTGSGGTFEPSNSLAIGPAGLSFYLHAENGVNQLAAAIPKLQRSASSTRTTGLYIVRFHADSVNGWDFVINLYPPGNNVSRDGLISLTGPLDGHIMGLVDDPGSRRIPGTVYDPSNPQAQLWDTGRAFTGWHTAVIERTPTRIEFYLDGAPTAVDDTAVPRAPLRFVLQSYAAAAKTSTASGHVTVSWVQIYQSARAG
jgi:hypothetical protein